MIPKIIHFCWLSTDPYPEKIKRCMDSWKKYLPDYEFVHWNFGRFPRGKSKWVDQAFDTHKYAFAADYIRMYALYHFGGIYLDTDVELLKSFDDLLDLPYFIGKEPSETGIEAAVLGFEKRHPLIKDMLDSYEGRDFISPAGDYDVYPLPYKFRACIESQYQYHPIQKKEDFVFEEETINIFSEDFFSPKDFHTLQIHTTENTYSIHHFAGSWMASTSTKESWKEKNALIRRWILKTIDWRNNVILMSNSNIDSMYDVSFSRTLHSPLYTARLSQEDFIKFLELEDRWQSLKLVQKRRKESKYKDLIQGFYPIACIEGTDIELHYTSNFSIEQILKIWDKGIKNIIKYRVSPILVSNDEFCVERFQKRVGTNSLVVSSNSHIPHSLHVKSLFVCEQKASGRGSLMLNICRQLIINFCCPIKTRT